MSHPNSQISANLRVCASCEYIFRRDDSPEGASCPMCNFGSYGARWVYGPKAYRYAQTQQPYIDKKMANYLHNLKRKILNSNRIN